MRTLVNAPAFDFDELRFDWGDVVLAAIGWGEWQQLERSLAVGLACASAAEDRGEQVDAAELRAATVAFRRAHRLLAGEDYMRWLDDRALSTQDVRAHLARVALRKHAGERTGDVLTGHGTDPGQLAETIRAEAILSGRLQSWAERLARCAAAARGLTAPEAEPPSVCDDAVALLVKAATACQASGLTVARARERAPRVTALAAAERGFVDRVVTRERVERCLAHHRLDWQRVVWEEDAFGSEAAAREAALSIRADGLALEEVAGVARALADVREAYCGDVPELSGLLVVAKPGELLGPFAADGGWRLACLRERTPPSAEDATLYARATAELVKDALERYLAGKVSWRGEY